MKERIQVLWESVRSSYLFLPTLMLVLTIALSFVAFVTDQAIGYDAIKGYWWIYTGGPEGARAVLSTVAGSVITVAGVTFSITIAALTLASSQFGPRLLRGFMRDTGNQFVLGTFIGTFMYCILVLRTVRGIEDNQFVPHIAVTLGVVQAIASVCVLIYFIHHVTSSIQASSVIAAVAHDLEEAMDRLFPHKMGQGGPAPDFSHENEALPHGFEREACPLAAAKSGYLQALDVDQLMALATEYDLLLRLVHRPGSFVIQGSRLAWVWPAGRCDDSLAAGVNGAFTLGDRRTPTQDIEFAFQQLVEVAIRALSPGINDPFTAIACVDRLGAALCGLADRTLPAPFRYDADGKLRVITDPFTFKGAADTAFHQIRQYGQTSAAVTIRMLEVIGEIAPCLRTPEQRDTLRRHARLIERGSHEGLPEEEDRADVAARYRETLQALSPESDAPEPEVSAP